MAKTYGASKRWSTQFLCLFLAALTACGPMNSKYTWHDVSSPNPTRLTKSSQMLDSWGANAEGPTVSDPRIAPGFLISIRSQADSKLNGDYRVDFDGQLQVPYDKSIDTREMTLFNLKQKLAEVYRPYFKTPSDIDVKIKERRYWIDVRGLVEKPGRYLVEQGASLDQLLGMSGGGSKETPPLYVRIQKGPSIFVFDLNHYYSQGDDKPKIQGWYGGEIVFFQKEMGGLTGDRTSASPYRLPVYMLGEVRRPGEYTLNPGSDFLDSLVLAGGFTEKADLDNIEIVRRTAGRKRIYNFSWDELQHAPTPFQGDVIYVHADNITKTERRVSLAATIIAAFASVVTSTVLILAYNKGRI